MHDGSHLTFVLYVQIFENPEVRTIHMLLCGIIPPFEGETLSNRMLVHFYTDYDVTSWGFKLIYRAREGNYFLCISWAYYLSRDITKPTKWLCAQWRLRSAGYPPSLIRVFALRLMGSYGPKLFSCAQRRFSSDLADAQADRSLRWAHSYFVGFVKSRLIWNQMELISLVTHVITNAYKYKGNNKRYLDLIIIISLVNVVDFRWYLTEVTAMVKSPIGPHVRKSWMFVDSQVISNGNRSLSPHLLDWVDSKLII